MQMTSIIIVDKCLRAYNVDSRLYASLTYTTLKMGIRFFQSDTSKGKINRKNTFLLIIIDE